MDKKSLSSKLGAAGFRKMNDWLHLMDYLIDIYCELDDCYNGLMDDDREDEHEDYKVREKKLIGIVRDVKPKFIDKTKEILDLIEHEEFYKVAKEIVVDNHLDWDFVGRGTVNMIDLIRDYDPWEYGVEEALMCL